MNDSFFACTRLWKISMAIDSFIEIVKAVSMVLSAILVFDCLPGICVIAMSPTPGDDSFWGHRYVILVLRIDSTLYTTPTFDGSSSPLSYWACPCWWLTLLGSERFWNPDWIGLAHDEFQDPPEQGISCWGNFRNLELWIHRYLNHHTCTEVSLLLGVSLPCIPFESKCFYRKEHLLYKSEYRDNIFCLE